MATTEIIKEQPTETHDVSASFDGEYLDIKTNMTFDIRINGKRLGAFRFIDGNISMIIHPDRFGSMWIATDRKVKVKKIRGKTDCRWVDLV